MATEVHFKNLPEFIEDDEPEALRMEHFHLPIGLWFVGTLISLLCFVAEIIKHRKTAVPMARLESRVESENLGGMVLSDMEAELDLAGSENIEDVEDEDTKVEVYVSTHRNL